MTANESESEPEPEAEIATAAARFGDDVPQQFQVSLSMSIETRDRLGAIRNELNDAAGENVLTTNDAMRIALIAAARYHALATGDLAEVEEIDEGELIPLTSVIRRTLGNDERVPGLSDRSE